MEEHGLVGMKEGTGGKSAKEAGSAVGKSSAKEGSVEKRKEERGKGGGGVKAVKEKEKKKEKRKTSTVSTGRRRREISVMNILIQMEEKQPRLLAKTQSNRRTGRPKPRR